MALMLEPGLNITIKQSSIKKASQALTRCGVVGWTKNIIRNKLTCSGCNVEGPARPPGPSFSITELFLHMLTSRILSPVSTFFS